MALRFDTQVGKEKVDESICDLGARDRKARGNGLGIASGIVHSDPGLSIRRAVGLHEQQVRRVVRDARDTSDISLLSRHQAVDGLRKELVGYSVLADDMVTVIAVEPEGTEYGVNGWSANAKDLRVYNAGNYEAEEGEVDEQG
jgi:hypothetical protein